MVKAGDPPLSPNKYLQARHVIDSQKLPVIVYAKIANGAAIKEPHMQTLEYILGLSVEYLSLIVPPRKADKNPNTLSERALTSENSDFIIGYTF